MKNRLVISLLMLCVCMGTLRGQEIEVDNVNSRYNEQSIQFNSSGTEMYFTRSYDSANVGGPSDKGDIFKSEFSQSTWSKPVNIGSNVNNKGYTHSLGMANNDKILVVGSSIPEQGVYYSNAGASGYSKLRKTEIAYFKNKSDHQSGSISADGSIMVLSLNSYSSRGEEDIYVCFYQDGKWTEPKNLGSTINTSGQEMTPWIAPDQKTLFFSSNGHGGYGGRDVFVSHRLNDTWRSWSKPQNLGDKVNSEGVELSFIIHPNGQWAYFTTTLNSDGYGDIRAVPVPDTSELAKIVIEEEVQLVIPEKKEVSNSYSWKFVDESNNEPIECKYIAVKNEVDTLQIGNGTSYQLTAVSKEGSVAITLNSNGYFPVNQSFVLSEVSTEYTIALRKIEEGSTFVLKELYFERSTANLLEGSYPELKRLLEVMQDNSDMKIELSGHTDNQGNSSLNLELSRQRAEMVKQYLVENGIKNRRVETKGYGASRPVASNATEESRKLNRRVEVLVVKLK